MELVPAVIQAVGIVVGAVLIRFQMKKQHQSNVEVQKLSRKNDTLVHIHSELVEKLNEATSTVQIASAAVVQCPLSLKNYWWQIDNITAQFPGFTPSLIEQRATTLIDASHTALKSLVELGSILESYEIVFANQRLCKAFKTMFVVQAHNQSMGFSQFFEAVSPYLPSEVEDNGVLRTLSGQKPTKESLEEIESQAWHYHGISTDTLALIMDLQIEAQNVLLGHLFENKVPRRVPGDSERLVVWDDATTLSWIEEIAKQLESCDRSVREIIDTRFQRDSS